MKRIVAAIFTISFLTARLALGAPDSEEDQLIATLQSDASLAQKDAACARLKRVGTDHCVPALAALLTDTNLSHSARYALESMPGSEAEKALLQGLQTTSGSNEVGIINSLAVRRDPEAVAALSPLLSNSDAAVANAAAEGLGKIGGPESLRILSGNVSTATGALHRAEVDSLLACANELLIVGRNEDALKVFQNIFDTEKPDSIRMAAYRGVLPASGAQEGPMVIEAIAGNDAAMQAAALPLAEKIEGVEMTVALAKALPGAPLPVQLSLLQCLGQRGDPSASAAVVAMLDNADPNVRKAAIEALADCGDQSAALPLAMKAASATGSERTAAREALVDLRHGPVTQTLTSALAGAPSNVQLELIQALGDRGDAAAAVPILKLAQSGGDSSSAAFQALALVGSPDQIPDLVQTVIQAPNDDQRSQAADALGAVCQRAESQRNKWDIQLLVNAVNTAPVPARVALLPVFSGLVDEPSRDALRAAIKSSDPAIRDAAIHALCATRDPELMPDLVQLASDPPEKKARVLAVRGCVQLTTSDEGTKLPADQKVETYRRILALPLDPAEKRLVLSALEGIADQQALALAVPLLDDPGVQAEAAQAVIHIAASISNQEPAPAGEALKKVLTMSLNTATHNSAERALKKIKIQ